MLSVLVLNSMLAISPAEIDTTRSDQQAVSLVAPELVFAQPFSAMEIDSRPIVASPKTVIRGQAPVVAYDEEPVQANLGSQQYLGQPPIQNGGQWNPMAPTWPGTPLIDPSGIGAPFTSIPGVNVVEIVIVGLIIR